MRESCGKRDGGRWGLRSESGDHGMGVRMSGV